ncbi:hypothetical protein Tco_1038990, partial [Tanacetum coccineum]
DDRLVSRAKAEDIASPAALAPLASDYIPVSSDYIPASNTKIEPFRHQHHRITQQGAIAKEIDALPYKRCRSSSPPKPSPPSSPSPPPAMLPPHKIGEVGSSREENPRDAGSPRGAFIREDVETLQTTLGIARERITDFEIRLEDIEAHLQESEARQIRLSTRMRDLDDRIGPSGERR